MSNSTIRALFQDGPRAGEKAALEPGPGGRPPQEVVVDDPLGAGGRDEASFDVEPTPTAATTYHLHGQSADDDTFVYGTGKPDR
ncbi:MAG TPA: hypothetical protein VFE65_18075 [Pseudonocardia sp.]|jgi:hypothetical protein|nr:hypothetical protein [Pseudonocardia sp.]